MCIEVCCFRHFSSSAEIIERRSVLPTAVHSMFEHRLTYKFYKHKTHMEKFHKKNNEQHRDFTVFIIIGKHFNSIVVCEPPESLAPHCCLVDVGVSL